MGWMAVRSTWTGWSRLRGLHWRRLRRWLLVEERRIHVWCWSSRYYRMLRHGRRSPRRLVRRQLVRRRHALCAGLRMRWWHLMRHSMMRGSIMRRGLRHRMRRSRSPVGRRRTRARRALHLRGARKLHRGPVWRGLVRLRLVLHGMRPALVWAHVVRRRSTKLVRTRTWEHHTRSAPTWTVRSPTKKFSGMRTRRPAWMGSSHSRIVGTRRRRPGL